MKKSVVLPPRNPVELKQTIAISPVDPDKVVDKNQILVEEYGKYLEALVHCVPTPLLVLDDQLRVKMVNECFYTTFKAKVDQTENCLIYDLGNGQWNIPSLRKFFEEILPSGKKFAHYEVTHKFETIGNKIMLLNARQIGTMPIILLNIEDITERRLRETELQELNSELGKHGSKLHSSNVELEHFAAEASHDLQEPLGIISNFMDLLASGYKGQLEPKAQEYIEIAKNSATRAQELIRSLLHYAKMDSEEKVRETVDVKSLVSQVLADLRCQVEDSSAEIICDPLPTIIGDKLQLGRVFQNLISNAIKYRREEPLKIHISARQENAAWIFKVNDNGSGFDSKYNDRIFDMFQRLHGREIAGVGIGLAACKKIVERHGGKIWAESEKGKGTSFYFSIPEPTVNR